MENSGQQQCNLPLSCRRTPILRTTSSTIWFCRSIRPLSIRTSTALGAYYRRLAYRIGKPKAITATARKLAILVYRTLKGELDYRDPGAEAYDARQRTRTVRILCKRAKDLGFALVERATGELQPG